MKIKKFYLSALCCISTLLVGCNEETHPLRFYDTQYEVPMGGRRYLGIESGNGDYSIAVEDKRIASAGTETGWTGVPAGRMIYVEGILTGTTRISVTDNATKETCTLPVKVVDNYENIRLSRSGLSKLPNGDPELLSGIDALFLINNEARSAYFFKENGVTAFSSGLELIAHGTYHLETREGDTALLTLTYPKEEGKPAYAHRFILYGAPYLLHRLDKNLNLGWNTPAIGETRTSPVLPPAYTLEEIAEETAPGEGRQISFFLDNMEMPVGILP